MAPRRRIRKVLLGLALFAIFILLLVSALPLWQPWVLEPLASHQGVHYTSYERIGFTRFALNNVSFTNNSTTLKAKRVEAFVPTVWLVKSYFSRQNSTTFLHVEDWQLHIQSPGTNVQPGESTTPYEAVQKTDSMLTTLRRWVPLATLTNGLVQADALRLQIPDALWQGGNLTASLNLPKYDKNLQIQLKSNEPGRSEIVVDSPNLELSSTIHISQTPTELNLQSTNLWRHNSVMLAARFRPNEKLPAEAALQAQHFDLPAELFKLPDYKNVAGSLSAQWQTNHFIVNLNANAQPKDSASSQLPPVDLVLHAHGNTESATIDTVRISAPWLTAELTENATIHFHGPLLTNPATVNLVSDLSKQPWTQLQGTMQGKATFIPNTNRFPEMAFDLGGSNIVSTKANLKTLTFQGHLLWPALELTEVNAELMDGSKAFLKGKADLKTKSINDGEVQLSGTFGREWSPHGYSFSNGIVSARFSGPLMSLEHSGKFSISQFTSPDLKPLDLQMTWQGQGTNSLSSEILLSTDASSLLFKGTAQTSTNQTTLAINALTLQTNGQPVLALEKPAQALIQRSNTQPSNTSQIYYIKLDPLNWLGDDKQLLLHSEINWPERGNLTNSIHGIDSGLFNGFLRKPLPKIKINDLQLSANWSNGPARFHAFLSSEGIASQNMPVSISGRLSGDGEGISISNLLVSTKGTPIFSTSGSLPIVIRPDHPTNLVDLLQGRPLQLQATTQTNSAFWEEFASLTGVTLQDPRLNLNLDGTWDSPQGKITLRARQIKLPETKTKLPVMDNLQLDASLDKSVARIDQLLFDVQGQPVRATGELPLSEEVWKQLIQKHHLPDWQQAKAHIVVEKAQVAAFAPLLPNILTPQGMINIDLSVSPGINLSGRLTLDNVQTRPLGALGPLRDIQAQMQFRERTVTLKIVTTVGGSQVNAEGRADLDKETLSGTLPRFTINVRGQNVPLARRPDLILRSDLDLAIVRTNDEPPLISGALRLRQSFYLQSINRLVPGRLAKPAERPPYFSIDNPALADWRLNIAVTGQRFMRVQDPLFNGEVSANLKLTGTLIDPIALGDVKIDSGLVQFPFGNLQVTTGFITLTSENPYNPQLQVIAASRQFGYDVRMEITGPANRPVIQFTSLPMLTSQQILLMLTTGQSPRSDFTLSPQQRVQSLAIYLGKSLLTKYGFTGGADRLTFRSGEDISTQGRPTYDVEYKLTKRWSVVGEYDRFGNFNGGFKWLLYSR